MIKTYEQYKAELVIQDKLTDSIQALHTKTQSCLHKFHESQKPITASDIGKPKPPSYQLPFNVYILCKQKMAALLREFSIRDGELMAFQRRMRKQVKSMSQGYI